MISSLQPRIAINKTTRETYPKNGKGRSAISGHSLTFRFEQSKILPFLALIRLTVYNFRILNLLVCQFTLEQNRKWHRVMFSLCGHCSQNRKSLYTLSSKNVTTFNRPSAPLRLSKILPKKPQHSSTNNTKLPTFSNSQ